MNILPRIVQIVGLGRRSVDLLSNLNMQPGSFDSCSLSLVLNFEQFQLTILRDSSFDQLQNVQEELLVIQLVLPLVLDLEIFKGETIVNIKEQKRAKEERDKWKKWTFFPFKDHWNIINGYD